MISLFFACKAKNILIEFVVRGPVDDCDTEYEK